MSASRSLIRWVRRHNVWAGVAVQAFFTVAVVAATVASFVYGWIGSIEWLGAITMLTWVDARAGNLLTAIVSARIAEDADVQDVLDRLDANEPNP